MIMKDIALVIRAFFSINSNKTSMNNKHGDVILLTITTFQEETEVVFIFTFPYNFL